MKSAIAFTGLALASAQSPSAGCDDAASCEAETTCHIDMAAGPGQTLSCNFPHIRQACCDMMDMSMTCHDDQDCMGAHMGAMPAGELQWLQGHGNPQDACPHLAALEQELGTDQNAILNYCQMPSGVVAAEHMPKFSSFHASFKSLQVPEPVVLDSGCDDAASCEAETTCHIDMAAGPGQTLSCDFPHIRRACCDMMDMSMTCHDDQDCMGSHMGAMPAGELQWLQGHGNPQDACPHLAALEQELGTDQNAILNYCQMPSGVVAAEHMPKFPSWKASVVMAQIQPQSQSPFLTGMLGFAAGAAVVTAIVATKKKRSSDFHTPLIEESA